MLQMDRRTIHNHITDSWSIMTENMVYQIYLNGYDGRFTFKVDHQRLPDVYTNHWANGVAWMEIKIVSSVPRDGILKPKWRPGQLAWIKEQLLKVGKDNVELVLFYEPEHECRLYQKCKAIYGLNEPYTVINPRR